MADIHEIIINIIRALQAHEGDRLCEGTTDQLTNQIIIRLIVHQVCMTSPRPYLPAHPANAKGCGFGNNCSKLIAFYLAKAVNPNLKGIGQCCCFYIHPQEEVDCIASSVAAVFENEEIFYAFLSVYGLIRKFTADNYDKLYTSSKNGTVMFLDDGTLQDDFFIPHFSLALIFSSIPPHNLRTKALPQHPHEGFPRTAAEDIKFLTERRRQREAAQLNDE